MFKGFSLGKKNLEIQIWLPKIVAEKINFEKSTSTLW